MAKKKTAVEVMDENMEEVAASAEGMLKEAGAPGGAGESGQEAETRAETPAAPERDWVKEAYECFVKDAKDIDPTDPVKAVEAYFQKNATDELKARCKAEGKDAEGCWEFIEAVARKALGSKSGHIDPAVVYAIAMHWFEDVPKDWDVRGRSPATPKAAKKETKAEKLERKVAQGQTETVRQKAKEELRKAKAAKKRKSQQGFFFEMLETPAETAGGEESPRTEREGEVAG